MTIGKGTTAGKKLNEYISQIEHCRECKKQLQEEEKAFFADAAAAGFDAPTIRKILKLRTLDKDKRLKADELLSSYLHALGMDDERPLFAAVGMMGVDITVREQVVAALEQFVPASGDIIVRVPGGAPVKLWRNEAGAVEVVDLDESEAEGLRKRRKRADMDAPIGEEDSFPPSARARTLPKSVVDRIADRAEAASSAKREGGSA